MAKVLSTDSKFLAEIESSTNSGTTSNAEKFLPNELDSVDSGTYNFKLYMTTVEASASGQIFDTDKQKVIAQSGVTADLEIKDVEIQSYIGYSSETHTGTSTNVDFTIVEPLGASLIDRLWYYARSLGISNYTKIPYYLELTFKGRSASSSLEDTSISSRRWVWPLTISKMDISVNAGGSEYRCKAIASGDLAYTNEYGTLTKDTTVTAKTVSAFLTEIANSLKGKQEDEKANNRTIPDEWIFVVDEEIGNSLIVPQKPEENPSKQSPFTIETKDKGTVIQFNDGTDILRAIDAVLGNCEYFQKKIKGKDTPDGNAEEADGTEKTNLKSLYRVYADSTIKAFDEKRGDYARKFYYYIKEYKVGTLDVTPQQVEKTNNISQNKLKEIQKKGFLKKRYDYIYTGLNTQVLDFNLDFNFLWYASLSQQSGLENASNTTSINSARTASTTEQQKKDGKKQEAGKESLAASPSATDNSPQSTPGTLPIAVNVSEYSQDLTYGIEGPLSDGKTIMSTMFNQATSPDALSLELEIKGDPYWLEPAPYNKNSKRIENKVISTLKPRPGGMYEKAGQVCILFTAKTPEANQLTSAETIPFKSGQSISGIYAVTQVKHSFSNGKFTQKITSYREKTIDVSLVPSLLTEF